MRLTNILIDLAAILVLAYGLYMPRYRRRDLLVSLLALNVGMLAVTSVLATTSVAAAAGFGIFGALSIVRLRSDELAEQDVGYYFAAVALAILGGIPVSPAWATPALAAMVLVVMFIGDHPWLFVRQPDSRSWCSIRPSRTKLISLQTSKRDSTPRSRILMCGKRTW